MSYRSNSLFTFWYPQKCMVMIDCLIEVAVFTVYVVALGGMGRERPRHAYSCIHFKDFPQNSYKPEQQSNLPPHFLKTKRKTGECHNAEELCTWLCRPRHGAFWRRNWKDLWDIYIDSTHFHCLVKQPQTQFCKTLEQTIMVNKSSNQINLVTFERNKKLLGLWYTYVTACKQCFND